MVKSIFLQTIWMFIPIILHGQYAAPFTASVGLATPNNNTVVGENSGSFQMTGNENSFFGKEAGVFMTSGKGNSLFGRWAGLNTTTGDFNSFFGNSAGDSNTSGDRNSFFGSFSGGSNTTGRFNSFIGVESGAFNTTGSSNTFLGVNSGLRNSTGSDNTFTGHESGRDVTNGSQNTAIGTLAGADNKSGSFNTYIGYRTTSADNSSFNTSVGHLAGWFHNGNENVFLGSRSGIFTQGHKNIIIGHDSGPISTAQNFAVLSERLFIDVQQSDTPLIYGEFDNDFVKINGTFEVTAGLSNPSDVNLKNNFEDVNATDILNKIKDLPITKWTYKDRQSETHIGATAQDFHQAFGLGTDDKRISTIDADGIALAAIKALKKENDQQTLIIEELLIRIQKLENN